MKRLPGKRHGHHAAARPLRCASETPRDAQGTDSADSADYSCLGSDRALWQTDSPGEREFLDTHRGSAPFMSTDGACRWGLPMGPANCVCRLRPPNSPTGRDDRPRQAIGSAQQVEFSLQVQTQRRVSERETEF